MTDFLLSAIFNWTTHVNMRAVNNSYKKIGMHGK